MPTKLNKAGNQQPYVPQGNGDASGEYADNQSGSNKHFTNFAKPEEKPQPKDTSGFLVNKLEKKQRKEVAKYIYGNKDSAYLTKDKLIFNLRYYTGSFGDLSGFTDDQLKQMIDEIQSLDFKKEDDFYYLKKGNKWLMTKNKEYEEFLGNKVYSKEELEELEKQKSAKHLTNQSDQDKNIQKIMGDSTVVCFGKGYSKEQMGEIEKATQVLVNDFEGLKGYVKSMGDRTNLENYLNAKRKQNPPTEEQIQNEINHIKSYSTYYGDNVEQRYREQAIRNLTGDIRITKLTRAYAYWCNSDRQMIFMPKMKNSAESLKHDYEANFHPTPDEISVYYHEMGHATDYMVAAKAKEVERKARNTSWDKYTEFQQIKHEFYDKFRELKNSNYNDKYKEIYENTFKEKYGVSPNDMNAYDRLKEQGTSEWAAEYNVKEELREKGINKYNVSQYAATNDEEFMAECFAGHYCNANNEICTKAVNLLKEYYNKIKRFENGL